MEQLYLEPQGNTKIDKLCKDSWNAAIPQERHHSAWECHMHVFVIKAKYQCNIWGREKKGLNIKLSNQISEAWWPPCFFEGYQQLSRFGFQECPGKLHQPCGQ